MKNSSILWVMVILLAVAPMAIAQTEQGVVEYVEGEVLIDGYGADFGDTVAPGARIQTGAGASVEIVFSGQNIFRLGENTVAILRIDGDIRRVDLRRGIFFAVLDRLQTIGSDRNAQFQLRTPTAVGGVRGTTFYAQVIDRDNTYVCTCNGVLHIEDSEGAYLREVTASEHAAYMFTRDSGSGRIFTQRVPVDFHSNEDMDELAAKVGVTVPWGFIR